MGLEKVLRTVPRGVWEESASCEECMDDEIDYGHMPRAGDHWPRSLRRLRRVSRGVREAMDHHVASLEVDKMQSDALQQVRVVQQQQQQKQKQQKQGDEPQQEQPGAGGDPPRAPLLSLLPRFRHLTQLTCSNWTQGATLLGEEVTLDLEEVVLETGAFMPVAQRLTSLEISFYGTRRPKDHGIGLCGIGPAVSTLSRPTKLCITSVSSNLLGSDAVCVPREP